MRILNYFKAKGNLHTKKRAINYQEYFTPKLWNSLFSVQVDELQCCSERDVTSNPSEKHTRRALPQVLKSPPEAKREFGNKFLWLNYSRLQALCIYTKIKRLCVAIIWALVTKNLVANIEPGVITIEMTIPTIQITVKTSIIVLASQMPAIILTFYRQQVPKRANILWKENRISNDNDTHYIS